MTPTVLLMLLAVSAHAADFEASGELGVGWAEYANLWSGDPLLGGFDLRSPPDPADRLLLSPSASLTLRVGDAHRFRLRPNFRMLQRVTTLDDELALVHIVVSDGVPLQEAWRERLFLDEASWRVRPDGDRWLELTAGILPFSVAGGRFLAESWPGGRVRVDLARKGVAPLTLDARATLTTMGTAQAALAIRHEPSLFEFVGLDIAYVRDRSFGIAPILESDLGLQLDVFHQAGAAFIEANEEAVFSTLYDLYGAEVDGIRLLQRDLQEYMALSGSADLLYLFAGGHGFVGATDVELGLIGLVGQSTLSGNGFTDGDWDTALQGHWPSTGPREPFDVSVGVRALAWDAAVDGRLGDRWSVSAFFQGMTGGGDVVGEAAAGRPITAFLVSNQSFLRTRVFPASTVLRSGSWTLPPGVSTHGLITAGTGVSLRLEPVVAFFQLALPAALVPSAYAPRGAIYGIEADLFVGWRISPHASLASEAGLFQPGSFFLDASDPGRDTVSDLPLGVRFFARFQFSFGEP